MTVSNELLTLKEASEWATAYTGKNVTLSNISYLIQYARIKKVSNTGSAMVIKQDLINYYHAYNRHRETSWKIQLGEDLNWALSFDQYKEADTTKHVHRLHPYKGKFIPQLVEYFLDGHTDLFKTQVFFNQGDIILDPFCGSGTTLVQANELGIHAVGVDISEFNTLISNVKIQKIDVFDLERTARQITRQLKEFVADSPYLEFDAKFAAFLSDYDKKHFPSPDFKVWVRNKTIQELDYTAHHEKIVSKIFNTLIDKYKIDLHHPAPDSFLDKWYILPIRNEIDFIFNKIKDVENKSTKKILAVILSRTIRSCRATTHADLATLIEPVTRPYYCAKHGKICKPLLTTLSWWERYVKDTIQRIAGFSKLRTETHQICLNGNSENIDIFSEIERKNHVLANLLKTHKIRGIFSSPPYVGLINYHEQHAYAYDLFGFKRNDEYEIGALYKKQSKKAQQEYVQGVSNVLNNSRRFMVENFDVFLVANDKHCLYPQIAESSGMSIVNQYKRPVLNRTEKDKGAYSETIFHLKDK